MTTQTLEKRRILLFLFPVISLLFSFAPSPGFVSDQQPFSFADLVQKIKPSVVNISTTQAMKEEPTFNGFQGPLGSAERFREFYERFFGDLPERRFSFQSLGSGFFIDESGLILTNDHVVENAQKIIVRLSDDEEFEANVIGRDSKTDLALLKINLPHPTPSVLFGDSDQLRVGDWVLAIGNPLGLEQTVTVGIVSAKGRFLFSAPYDDFIQTDASINPGNSGGPLFNTKGEVVGVNTAIASGGQGIGFAIPINVVKLILGQLKERGKVSRGWLGIGVQQLTTALVNSFKLKEKRGALISDVAAGSPAEKGGVHIGDIVIEFDGQRVQTSYDLLRFVANTSVGREVPLKILRNGKEISLKVTVEEFKEEVEDIAYSSAAEEDILGLFVQGLTQGLARYIGIRESNGVVVSGVESGGPGEGAGIRQGDVIKEVNRKVVVSLKDYKVALSTVKPGDIVLLLVHRAGKNFFVALKSKGS
ncbi:MAG: Do family serine endopeptidase [Candidatus Tectomicrobia bacterium]|nr:Do family serine endopeptidase [Candidatus Tectomicrobia bacterium]